MNVNNGDESSTCPDWRRTDLISIKKDDDEDEAKFKSWKSGPGSGIARPDLID